MPLAVPPLFVFSVVAVPWAAPDIYRVVAVAGRRVSAELMARTMRSRRCRPW
jgi:hypothetical protein